MYVRYGWDKTVSSEKYLNLYSKVRKFFYKEVSLVTIKDHPRNTLNSIVATQNRVVEMRLNFQKIPVPDSLSHLHKKIGEISYTYLMKDTLKVSNLQYTISIIDNQLK